ncbi:hypothetical protein [Alkanindiges illinoisensis]|uniref:hypothetical protein n=1 Tax=Alkanindiges illinoisensis TaxID=197183 RepID=UPI0012EBE1D8|nr:hypothetical protein [Alkanindiges illinoisensis]
MNKFPLVAIAMLLNACGGGGSGDSFNSSFNGEVTVNGQKYQCPSQKTYDACSNSSNRDCSGCSTDSSNTDNSVITAACTATSSSIYQITQNGCTINLSTGKQTGVCVAGSLRLLSGTGFTKAQVSAQGVSFVSGVRINGVTLSCAA